MIFGEVDDGVFAGDVGGGDDGELVPGDGGVEVDGEDSAAGDGAADGGSEPHVGEGDVVYVFGLAEDFGRAFFAQRGAAYGSERLEFGLDWVRHGRVWIRDFDIR